MEKFAGNHGHKSIRAFDVLSNFVFSARKRSSIINNKHGTFELANDLLND